MTINFLQKILGFIRLFRIEITPLGILCVYIGAVSAGSKYFSLDLFFAMIAVFLTGAGSMSFNDYFDYEIDKKIHPDRPLPKGVLKPKTAFWASITLFIFSLLLSFSVNLLVFLFTVIGITLIVLYEIVSKRQGFIGNIFVSMTTSLAFVYGGAVVGNLLKPLFFTVVAFFVFLSREIFMDIRDLEGDQISRKTLPVMIGRKKSVYLGCLFLVFSMFFLYIEGFLIFSKIWYLFLCLPVFLVGLYGLILSFLDIENASRTADIFRFLYIQLLILFAMVVFL